MLSPAPLDRLPPLREVIARFDLMARKSLGQHFLCDLNLTRRIAEAAGDLTGCTVVEIGPGPGGLTRALLGTPAIRVIAIEKDRRCIAALGDVVTAAAGRLEVIEGDALELDPVGLAPEPRAIVANLPYNIGTPLLIGWLRQIDQFRSLTLMFQAEVADRIAALPGSKAYGRLSVLAQHCASVTRLLNIPAQAFTPPPKIDSAVIRLTPRLDRPADIDLKLLENVTAAAFGQRRKMLRASLKPLGGEALLRSAAIDPQERAENLSIAQFEELARLIGKNRS